ncbi:hypothetical protein EXIGLDRAFT_771418 [Exidia glandulosa HHB12029]|uniref:Uncharacterized protein n=1 Tax=Exidia glandulosa HHB12029 TaxID=1314781 RepID=A0A165G0U9_EXIGL|nr:hypothetical protein EXIGLDRAFT_771418 [Exidia glandulosa HHB12029]
MSFFNLLRPLTDILGFATFKPSADAPEQRVAIAQDPNNLPGSYMFRPVPPAILGPGVFDEGMWPRPVMWDGESVMMSRNEWDALKLSGQWDCIIENPHTFPKANLKTFGGYSMPRSAPISSAAFAQKLKSAMSVDSSFGGPRTPRVPQQSPSYMSVCTPSPAPSTSSMGSCMSVDTVVPGDRMSVDRSPGPMWTRRGSTASVSSVASDDTIRGRTPEPWATPDLTTPKLKKNLSRASSTTTETKNNGRKRAHHQQHKYKASRSTPEPKRHRPSTSKPPMPTPLGAYVRIPRNTAKRARDQRLRDRKEYHLRRRELAAALVEAELRAEAAHYEDLMRLRRRLEEMDEQERRARAAEERRLEGVRRLQEARMKPLKLPPILALDLLMKRFTTLAAKRTDKLRIELDDLPLPVLYAGPYSLRLVTFEAIDEFFRAIKPVVAQKGEKYLRILKRMRIELHPDRWAGAKHRCDAPEGCEDELVLVNHVMTEVMKWINPNLEAWIGSLHDKSAFTTL